MPYLLKGPARLRLCAVGVTERQAGSAALQFQPGRLLDHIGRHSHHRGLDSKQPGNGVAGADLEELLRVGAAPAWCHEGAFKVQAEKNSYE